MAGRNSEAVTPDRSAQAKSGMTHKQRQVAFFDQAPADDFGITRPRGAPELYGWLLRVAPLPFIATYAYVNPVVAVILGTVVLGEPLDARTVVAGVVIVGAVALIVTARSRMQAPRGATATEPVARVRTEVTAPSTGSG